MTALRPVLPTSARQRRWRLFAMLAMLAGCAFQAVAQEDPPDRVAYLGMQQGTLSFAPAGDGAWYEAQPNRPLTAGDQLWSETGARAELQAGSATLRMDERTQIELTQFDAQKLRVTVQQGMVQLYVRAAPQDQRIEIATANLLLAVNAPGDYRIAADPRTGATQVQVLRGAAAVYGDAGASIALAEGQQIRVAGRDLAPAEGAWPLASADFERWALERTRQEEASVSARYVSREVAGYQQLDAWGDWQYDASYGPVWAPRGIGPDWAPYSDGEWVFIAPWGMTWVDRAPWGFAPFHYGRWTRIGARWCWVPGRQQARPVYAPALVAFVGGGRGDARAALRLADGRPGIGWFPLAPGEAWRPGFRASPAYIERANRIAVAAGDPRGGRTYLNQSLPRAVTAAPADQFGRAPLSRRDFVRPPPESVAAMRAFAAPPADAWRGAPGFNGRRASALPPPAAQAQTFVQPRPQQAMPPQIARPQPPSDAQQAAQQQALRVQQEALRQQQLPQPAGQARQQAFRAQNEAQQRAAAQAQQAAAQQQQQAVRAQQEAQRQQQLQSQQAATQARQQAFRAQNEAQQQQRAAAQQQQQALRAQQEAQRQQQLQSQQAAAQARQQAMEQAQRAQAESQRRIGQTQQQVEQQRAAREAARQQRDPNNPFFKRQDPP